MGVVLGVRNEQIHLIALEHRRASGGSNTFLRTATLKRSFASEPEATALYGASDLNRLSTGSRLWCGHVAPRISVDRYRPVAAAGRRAGSAGS